MLDRRRQLACRLRLLKSGGCVAELEGKIEVQKCFSEIACKEWSMVRNKNAKTIVMVA